MALDDLAKELQILGAGVPPAPTFQFEAPSALKAVESGGTARQAAQGAVQTAREGLSLKAETQDLDRQMALVDTQLTAMADQLAVGGNLQARAQQLDEFTRLTNLNLSNIQRQIGLKTKALGESLRMASTQAGIRQQDTGLAIDLMNLKTTWEIKSEQLNVERDLEMGKLDVDRAMLKLAMKSLKESERGIRIANDYERAVIESGNDAALAGLLSGLGNVSFATAGLTLQLTGSRDWSQSMGGNQPAGGTSSPTTTSSSGVSTTGGFA